MFGAEDPPLGPHHQQLRRGCTGLRPAPGAQQTLLGPGPGTQSTRTSPPPQTKWNSRNLASSFSETPMSPAKAAEPVPCLRGACLPTALPGNHTPLCFTKDAAESSLGWESRSDGEWTDGPAHGWTGD